MTMSSKVFSCIFSLVLVAITCASSCPLQCSERNGKQTFRILQVTDTHFGTNNNTTNAQSQKEISDLISYEQPDLVSLSGDMVSGWQWDGKTKDWFKSVFNVVVEPIESSKTYWAYTLGNHDDQGDWNRSQIIDYASTFDYSLTESGPTTLGGVSNYVLTVFLSNDTNKEYPIANIWYLDSLDENCYNVSGYNCVEFTNIEWYRQTSIDFETKYKRKIPGIMYIHIPMPEILMLYNGNSWQKQGMFKDSGVCCWSLNTGLFSVLLERNDVTSVWHGHDHDNDFCGDYHGITIGYGRKTGFGGYGPASGMSRGARVIEFECNKNTNGNNDQFIWSTWIREDDGNKVTNQPTLNGTNWQDYQACCKSLGDDNTLENRNLDPKRVNHDHIEL